jgi:Response regulator containing a CheY-like receiver domain and an HTH DNA-binding domain
VTIRVLLVDDQPLLRTGFRLILEGEPDIAVVGEAGDGARAVELTRTLLPEVVLMDIRMPGVDGIEATRRIVREEAAKHDPRVLILTTFDLDEYVVEAVRAGRAGSCSRTRRRRIWSPRSASWPTATRSWRRA